MGSNQCQDSTRRAWSASMFQANLPLFRHNTSPNTGKPDEKSSKLTWVLTTTNMRKGKDIRLTIGRGFRNGGKRGRGMIEADQQPRVREKRGMRDAKIRVSMVQMSPQQRRSGVEFPTALDNKKWPGAHSQYAVRERSNRC